jgi:hypothetical protein
MMSEYIMFVSIGMFGWGLGFFTGCVYSAFRIK